MGVTVAGAVAAGVGIILAINPKAQEIMKIDAGDIEKSAVQIKNISLAAGGFAGGLAGVINFMGTREDQLQTKARANAVDLSYVNRLIEERGLEDQNQSHTI